MLRRLQLVVLAIALVVAAFASGAAFLFYLVYLGLLVVGGSYVLTRLGLADLEAGYAVGASSGGFSPAARGSARRGLAAVVAPLFNRSGSTAMLRKSQYGHFFKHQGKCT